MGRMVLMDLGRRRDEAFRQQGITFAISDPSGAAQDRPFPLDLVPRIIPAHEWEAIERGLVQRIKALNEFLDDVYHGREIVREGIVPWELVVGSPEFRRGVHGIRPPGGTYCHVAGCDLVRGGDGRWKVLEDNVRTPSGISYVLENRLAMTRLVPEMFAGYRVRPVDHYPQLLLSALREIAPAPGREPTVVVWTPGPANSAYFEHSFLARQMGVELVEASDLVVRDDICYMRTTEGLARVDAIYRRLDDDFIDPLEFRPDSLLGVPGLIRAYRAGTVALANAVGTGVADDKAVYGYVPEMIRYYLGEEPILDNVPTYLLRDPEQLEIALARLDEIVVKPVNESGGKGVFIGPRATEEQIEAQRALVRRDPAIWIGQELVHLSTTPTVANDGELVPRHVDLRPFAVFGSELKIVPGGLTRVALREGSMIVNSSRGGGSKDTWVLASGDGDRAAPESPSRAGCRRCRRSSRASGPGRSNSNSREPTALATAARDAGARIAHELYWIGRYVARADDTARMLDGLFRASLQSPGGPDGAAAPVGGGDDRARRRPRPRGGAGARERGGPPADARPGKPGVGDHVRRARARRDEARPRRRLAGDVAGAQHALPRARHERPRLRGRDRPAFDLLLRARALRALVGPRRRDDASRPGLRIPRRRPARRGREHDAADAASLDRPRPARRRGDGWREAARRRPCCRRSAAPRRSGARCPGPADAYPVATFLLFEESYPHSVAAALELLHDRLRDADPSYRTAPPLLRLARLRAELEFHHRQQRRSSPIPWPACSSTCRASSPRPTGRSSGATSAAPRRTARGDDMRFRIVYATGYEYSEPVRDNLNVLRVRPATTPHQTVDDFSMRVDPEARLHQYRDYFGAEVIEFGVTEPHEQLAVEARMHVTTREQPVDPDGGWELTREESYRAAAGRAAAPPQRAARRRADRRAGRRPCARRRRWRPRTRSAR